MSSYAQIPRIAERPYLHLVATESERAKELLDDWDSFRDGFWKVSPEEDVALTKEPAGDDKIATGKPEATAKQFAEIDFNQSMKAVLFIALGGAMGALSRAALVNTFDWLTPKSNFPWGILAANLLGCLAIGLVFGAAENRNWLSEATRMMVLVGFLGSFTTFSTFGWNTFELFRNGQAVFAIANVAISVIGGLAAVWAGWAIAR